jgi:hypothetical protein
MGLKRAECEVRGAACECTSASLGDRISFMASWQLALRIGNWQLALPIGKLAACTTSAPPRFASLALVSELRVSFRLIALDADDEGAGPQVEGWGDAVAKPVT